MANQYTGRPSALVSTTCAACGKTFSDYRSQRRKCCSRECSDAMTARRCAGGESNLRQFWAKRDAESKARTAAVAYMIAKGESVVTIARNLGVSRQTVYNAIKRISPRPGGPPPPRSVETPSGETRRGRCEN